jgi:hypothetical protein
VGAVAPTFPYATPTGGTGARIGTFA